MNFESKNTKTKTRQIMKIKHILFALISTMILVSCGKRVEVPPAHIGLVKTETGIEDEIRQPSSFRLPFSLTVKNQLITIETSNFQVREEISMFMPKDQLKFDVDIRGICSIDQSMGKKIADKIPASQGEDDILRISSTPVYSTYAQQVIRSQARSVLAKYTITEVLTNLDQVSDEIYEKVSNETKGSPIRLVRLDISKAQPPKVIMDAQELRKKREVAIDQAEAEKAIALKEAESRFAVEQKNQAIDLLEAETQVLVEKKLSESVNSAFVTQRALKILEKMAESPNKVFVLPSEALQNPSIMLGIHQQGVKGGIKQ